MVSHYRNRNLVQLARRTTWFCIYMCRRTRLEGFIQEDAAVWLRTIGGWENSFLEEQKQKRHRTGNLDHGKSVRELKCSTYQAFLGILTQREDSCRKKKIDVMHCRTTEADHLNRCIAVVLTHGFLLDILLSTSELRLHLSPVYTSQKYRALLRPSTSQH